MASLDLSCSVSSKEGLFLGRLVCEQVLGNDPILKKDDFFASPHNGPRHEFKLKMDREDASAFLDLIQEKFSKQKGCTEFLAFARGKLG